MSAYGLGNLGASLLGGHLADKLGRRKTILLSMFSGAAMMMLLSQAHGLGADYCADRADRVDERILSPGQPGFARGHRSRRDNA